ncbi:signal peptide peptidase SppA [Chelativorans salis]|uniref:Signal peptide peptidase SppA n=1 Tax=Chelativorans salis TaxID=2978478 RepID=A0ABT2LVM4_9HYPH|nr:signal peptide peptidase SppA [Chelativorans sp. EGI FJ00035]MCT7378577.1 signal peptide peptidase SppA [Chelativorans sp. EGI FJ00035]
MSTRADDLIDRRRLRRKLTFWRVIAFLIIALALAASVQWMFGEHIGTATAHIAQVRIEGTITEDDELLDRLDRIRESTTAKGVILTIDSPGGTTAGGEAIFEEIRRLAEEKPVVAQVGTLAASAGYMIASAADHIVVRQSSIVGSIGVIVQIPNVTGLMDNVGVTVEEVKSSPLKAEPSPFNQTTEEERAMLRAMVLDSYDWFIGLVTDRRPLSRSEVKALADGSVFTGRQALERKLVDALGGVREAREWLVERGVDENLSIVEWKADSSGGSLFLPEVTAAWLARVLGLPHERGILSFLGAERIFLDGLLSVWQPEMTHLPD